MCTPLARFSGTCVQQRTARAREPLPPAHPGWDVTAFRAGEPVAAFQENLWERTRRVAIRYRTPILLVVAYLMMRITLLAFFGR